MNHFVFSAQVVFFVATAAAFFFFTKEKFILKLIGFYWSIIAFWSATVAFQDTLIKLFGPTPWGWFLHLGCIFIPAVFLHFTVHFTSSNRLVIYLGYSISAAYLLLNTFTSLFTFGTAYRDNYAYPIPSSYYIWYFFTFILMIILGTVLL